MRAPALSVLIDTYNHERYIDQAIVSVLEQDFPASDMEILVVDDGSTDRTPEIVRKFAPRVRLLRKKNGGQASALNAAFPEVRGEIISFLDGDDWFAPGKLTPVMNALGKHPEAAAASHGYFEFHEATAQQITRTPSHVGLVDLSRPEIAATFFFGGLSNCVQMGALTARKSIWSYVHPIPEKLVFCGDNPIVMAALAKGTYILDQPLFYYRFHSTNLCATSEDDPSRARRRFEIYQAMVKIMEPLLAKIGVRHASITALLQPYWCDYRRSYLSKHGGSRLDALRTELSSLQIETTATGAGYRLFRYLILMGSVILPARQFYKARAWYFERKLGRFRERLFKAKRARRVEDAGR